VIVPESLFSTDPMTERRAELYYRFLKGMSYLNNEESERAGQEFETAVQLSDKGDELLRAQLVSIKIEQADLLGALQHSQRIMEQSPQAYDYLIHAGILDSLGNYAEAQKYYLMVLKEKPDDVASNLYLANALYASGNPSGAESRLRKLLAIEPEISVAHFYLGNLAAERLDFSSAIRAYEKTLKIEPDNKKVDLALLNAQILKGDISGAKKRTQLLAETWQEEALSLVLKATLALLEKGQSQSASLFLKSFLGDQAIEIQELRRHIGILQVQGRDFTSAVFTLGLVLAKDPNDAKARYFLGTTYAALGARKRAVIELQKIPNSDSMYIEAQTFAAFLMKQIGNLAGAQGALKLALSKMEEPDLQLQLFLVEIMRAQNRHDQAATIVSQMLLNDPQNPKLIFLYGSVLEDIGKHDEAVSVMESLIRIDPDHAQGLNFIAYNLAERGRDLDRAMILSERALADYPEDGYFLDTKGWILFRQGKAAEASRVLSRAVNLTGDDPVIVEHYAEALLAQGEEERGLSVFLSIVQRKLDLENHEIKHLDKRARSRIRQIVKTNPDLNKVLDLAGYSIK
jgi:tetratricopeptide (TPR) repeat protein